MAPRAPGPSEMAAPFLGASGGAASTQRASSRPCCSKARLRTAAVGAGFVAAHAAREVLLRAQAHALEQVAVGSEVALGALQQAFLPVLRLLLVASLLAVRGSVTEEGEERVLTPMSALASALMVAGVTAVKQSPQPAGVTLWATGSSRVLRSPRPSWSLLHRHRARQSQRPRRTPYRPRLPTPDRAP